MCLSIALQRPDDVLARGDHAGFEWMVIHNGSGYRCGYVRLPAGHPWHGKDEAEVPAEVHGGLTFARPDVRCDKGGDDDAYWLGFDCAHLGDLPDLTLLVSRPRFDDYSQPHCYVRTQEYVEAECRSLCEQAARAASAAVVEA